MLKLEDLKPGLPLVGLEPSVVATVAAVVPIGEDSRQVFYRTPDGTTKERLLGRVDEASLGYGNDSRENGPLPSQILHNDLSGRFALQRVPPRLLRFYALSHCGTPVDHPQSACFLGFGGLLGRTTKTPVILVHS
jgi:hypothetical protein